ncbi:MAG: hypothetical protein RI564_02250, partial [Gracilimonas sp.]|nr:hypothetical protein [Gracilimonas sp.]
MKIQLHKSAFVIVFFVFLIVSGSAFAQQSQVIHLNNRVYHHIKNLQQRGYFSELNPTKLPYTKGEINSSLRNIKEEELSATEAFWYQQVQEEIGFDPSNSEEPYLYGMLEAGLDFNNTLSGNGLRPQSDKIYLLPNIASNLYAGKGGFSAQLGLRHDSFYDYDRLGEIVNSRFGLRSEDYYVGYKNDFFNIYIGKFQNLWAPYGEAST